MKKTILAVGLLLLVLTGCKPTEKNYRQAYDAAIAKRQQQAEQSLPADGLILADAPRQINIGGKNYNVSNEGIKTAEDEVQLRKVCVAVAAFKMPTNAKAEAAALKKEGYPAVAAKTASDRWYVVASDFASVDEAAAFIEAFAKKHSSWPYIGLDGKALIIRNSLASANNQE